MIRTYRVGSLEGAKEHRSPAFVVLVDFLRQGLDHLDYVLILEHTKLKVSPVLIRIDAVLPKEENRKVNEKQKRVAIRFSWSGKYCCFR